MLKVLVAGKPNNAALGVSLFLTMVVMVMWGVYMGGLTKTSGPIYNIYHGRAEIEHVNVTKILPISAPILQFLGGALLSKNVSNEMIFGSLKRMAQTEALAPMLQLLTNTTNSVGTLAELAAANSGKEKPVAPLKGLLDIMQTSKNASAVVEGLSLVAKGVEAAKKENASVKSDAEILALMAVAGNDVPKAVHSLNTLAAIPSEDRLKLSSILITLHLSPDPKAFATALEDFLNKGLKLDDVREIISQFNAKIQQSTNASEIAGIADEIAKAEKQDSSAAVSAMGAVLGHAASPSGALQVLNSSAELLNQPGAKPAAGALKGMMEAASNTTKAIEFIMERAGHPKAGAAEQVMGLDMVLQNAVNSSETFANIIKMQMASTEESQKALPSLLGLLSYSTDKIESMKSVIKLIEFGEKSPDVLNPVLEVLQASVKVNRLIPSKEILDLTPTILENFNVAARYRLGIFTICKLFLNGTQKACSKPHVVQGFDYRNILYTDLMDSDLAPYIKTLRVGPNDLYLEGKLLEKQPMYEPSIRAHLAFDILGLLSAFILLFTLAGAMTGALSLGMHAWVNRLLVAAVAGFALLSATVIQIVTAVVKWGAKIDNYGVVYKQGTAQATLSWVAFVLEAIVVLIVWGAYYAGGKSQGVVNVEEGRASTSDEDIDKEKISRPHPAHPDI
ncbi:FAER090Wp [Eremothecium gossypii FDAG1]|nr:FAER090Wp [Eremothecium gossypii FDAG1]